MIIHETENDDALVSLETNEPAGFFVFRGSQDSMESFTSSSLIEALKVYRSWVSRSFGTA